MPAPPPAPESPSSAGKPAEGGSPRLYGLVPCAGVGARSGADRPKQYVELAGAALVAHTLRTLTAVPRLHATLVVLAPDDREFEARVPGFAGGRCWTERCGGATRAATVAAGLAALQARGADSGDWVLVHDAARCLLQPAWVERLIDACIPDPVGGLLAQPVADTLKTEEGGLGLKTLLVASTLENFKVTYPDDFALAARLLRSNLAASDQSLPGGGA